MANINQHWEKFVALGCNHGHLGDPKATKGALRFVQEYKPSIRVHGGDGVDFTGLRGGAHGTKDEVSSLTSDINGGVDFIAKYRPTHARMGNHEARVYKNADHPNAIVARCAMSLIAELHGALDAVKCSYKTAYDITDPDSYLVLGNICFFHGWYYNVSAIRDHAETICGGDIEKIVHFHTHTPGFIVARRFSPLNPTAQAFGYSGGSLADFRALSYANGRRATTAWAPALVAGEVCRGKRKDSRIWLVTADKDGTFHLPR